VKTCRRPFATASALALTQPWWRGVWYNTPVPGSLLERGNHGCVTWMFESERGTVQAP